MFRRYFNDSNICAYGGTVRENGFAWKFQIFKNPRKSGPLWAVPHDNERPPVGAAAKAVLDYGGTFVTLQTKENRYFFGQDTNRNFSDSRTPACKQAKGRKAPVYSRNFFRHLSRGKPVIALHSNSVGGGLTINSKFRGDVVYKTTVNSGFARNPDTFIYMAATDRNMSRVQRLKDQILARGFNVRFEMVSKKPYDCSMSVYAAIRYGSTKYINIEVPENVSSDYQFAIIKSLYNLL